MRKFLLTSFVFTAPLIVMMIFGLIQMPLGDCGDLVRIGQLSKDYCSCSEICDGLQPIEGRTLDILVFGDSFSNSSDSLANYTYWLEQLGHNVDVVNCAAFRNNSFLCSQRAPDDLIAGYDVVIVERIERCMTDLLDAEDDEGFSSLGTMQFRNIEEKKDLGFNFFTHLTFSSRVLLRELGFSLAETNIQIQERDKVMFSSCLTDFDHSATLITYSGDAAIQDTTGLNLALESFLIEQNARISTLGCRLLFLPIPDKHTFYSFPEKTFDTYSFIDFQSPYVFDIENKLFARFRKGVDFDVYKFGDTHWTCKTASALAQELSIYLTTSFKNEH